MKKIISIIGLAILCTGCTATYKLNIKNNNVKENLIIEETNSSIFDLKLDNGTTIRESFKNVKTDNEFVKTDSEIKYIDSNSKLGLKYKNKSELSNYLNSSVLNQCYDNPAVEITDEYFYIDTGVYFNCFDYYEYLDNIKIVLKTNHVVEDNNADEIKNGKYIWNINKSNYKDKSINIKLSMTDYEKDYTTIFIIAISSVVFLIISFAFINMASKKIKNRNKF